VFYYLFAKIFLQRNTKCPGRIQIHNSGLRIRGSGFVRINYESGALLKINCRNTKTTPNIVGDYIKNTPIYSTMMRVLITSIVEQTRASL
jgi:hypothetical protein